MLRALDFVTATDKGGVDLWSTAANEDWHEGCRIGRNRAEQTIDFIREHQDAALIGRIINTAVAKQDSSSVLTGFTTRISEELIVSAA